MIYQQDFRKRSNKTGYNICGYCEEFFTIKGMSPRDIAKRKFCSEKCCAKQHSGKNHCAWKGDKIGYYHLHMWVKYCKGKADKCEFCGEKQESRIQSNGKTISNLHLANKSGEYKRDLDDWFYLCAGCHKRYDAKNMKQSAREVFKKRGHLIK